MFTENPYAALARAEESLTQCNKVLEDFHRRYNSYSRPKFDEKDALAVKLVNEYGKIMGLICLAAFHANNATKEINNIKMQVVREEALV